MAEQGRIVGIFPVGDTGSTFKVAEWFPDPDIVMASLLRFATALGDPTEPLEQCREAIIYSTETYFETTSDPYGHKWVELVEKYQKWKVKHGGSSKADLVLNDSLRKSVTSEDSWKIIGSDIVFKVPTDIPYAAWHQEGTSGGLKGQQFQKAANKKQETYTEADKAVLAKGARGLNLPQRQFIGMNELTILEVEEIFKNWIDGLEEEIWDGPMGPPIVPMGENELGRFPIYGYTKRGQPLLRTPKGIRFGRRR